MGNASKPTFSENVIDLWYVRDDALSDTMCDGACLARRAAATDNREHVERTKHAGKLKRTHDAFTVILRREKRVQRHVVDQDRRHRH
jgi:hypothetical protein